MRCDCCNIKLLPLEENLKHNLTDEFLNTCLKCLTGLGIPIKANQLIEDSSIPSDEVHNEDMLIDYDEYDIDEL